MPLIPSEDLLPLGLIAGVTVTATWLAMPESTRRVVREPSLLVPGVMTLSASWLALDLAEDSGAGIVHDNPFGIGRSGTEAGASPIGLVLMPLTAVLIAGLIGLAERRDGSGVRTRDAFTRGVLDHTVTVLIAKGLLWAAHLFLAQLVAPRSIGLLLFLIPSVLFAPILGYATQRRRRPLAAIRSGTHRALEDPASVTGQVTALAAFLLAVSLISERTGHTVAEREALPAACSILSFHPTALWSSGFDSGVAVFGSVAAVLVSTVAMLECWRRTRGEMQPNPSAVRDEVV